MIKPMLSAKCPPNMTMEDFLNKIRFPVLATPKIDGIRCITWNKKALTRSLKYIPNLYTRESIQSFCPQGLDGELIVGDTFQSVTSGIMTQEGKPDFKYYVFGCNIDLPYRSYKEISADLSVLNLPSFCVKLLPTLCNDLDELLEYEVKCLQEGAEGVMIREPTSIYKYGRSTLNEQYLVAVKRFQDEEGKVVGFIERVSNQNIATVNNLGYTERSSHQDNLVPLNTLGAMWIETEDKRRFKIGTGIGLNDILRKEIWNNQDKYINRTVTFKYQLHGTKDLPRIPVFKGFRED